MEAPSGESQGQRRRSTAARKRQGQRSEDGDQSPARRIPGARSRQEELEQRQKKRSDSKALSDHDEGGPFLSSDVGVYAKTSEGAESEKDSCLELMPPVSADPYNCDDPDVYSSQTSRRPCAFDAPDLACMDGNDTVEGEEERAACQEELDDDKKVLEESEVEVEAEAEVAPFEDMAPDDPDHEMTGHFNPMLTEGDSAGDVGIKLWRWLQQDSGVLGYLMKLFENSRNSGVNENLLPLPLSWDCIMAGWKRCKGDELKSMKHQECNFEKGRLHLGCAMRGVFAWTALQKLSLVTECALSSELLRQRR